RQGSLGALLDSGSYSVKPIRYA
ncbi:hypothetical protein PANDA_014044, partial [Ailuropoda melanoleuca]